MNDEHFMEMALFEAEQALAAGEFPVGCILVADGSVVASGGRTGTRGTLPNELDHAEMTALRRLVESHSTIDPAGITVYITMEPCLMCFGSLILNRIGRVVWAYEDVMGGGTACDLSGLPPLYRHSPIILVAGVLRNRSLALFKRFFANPRNSYWHGSLLSQYTLAADADT
jgi:tRNA(adenine34) deaminase